MIHHNIIGLSNIIISSIYAPRLHPSVQIDQINHVFIINVHLPMFITSVAPI
jgi:hypothetical protein